jgi:type I restriction enzyme, S subunit
VTLPEGWTQTTAGECSETIQYGLTCTSSAEGTGYRYIRITDIQDRQIDWTTVPYATESADKAAAYRVQKGDLLFARTGATVGKSYLVENVPELAAFASYLIRVRTNGDVLLAEFAAWYFQSPPYWQQIMDGAEGTGQPNFNGTKLGALALQLPPLAEQRRIVSKLDRLSARLLRARSELDRVPILADRLRDAALTSVLEATRDAPARSVSDLSVVMFDGPFGSNLKSADYSDSGARVVRLENIGHLRFIDQKRTFISLSKYKALTRHTLLSGDILFSSFVDRNVRVCRFPEGIPEPTINKADCFVARPDETKCDGKFLAYMLAAPASYEALKEAVHGATRPRIGLSQLRNYPVHLPPLETQHILAAELDTAFARADRLEAEAARARTLLDRLESAILAKAFRGELVPQDSSDEPASVLFERIRAQRAADPKRKRGRRVRAVEAADA